MPRPAENAFAEGVRLHNAGEYFAAHEAWEELWRSETEPERRRFLQGLIQVTAGMHKLLVQRVPANAERLLRRGLSKLEEHPPEYGGIALAEFRDATRACADAVAALAGDPARIGSFDLGSVPVVRYLRGADVSTGGRS